MYCRRDNWDCRSLLVIRGHKPAMATRMQKGPLVMASDGNMSRNFAYFFTGGPTEAADTGIARISVTKPVKHLLDNSDIGGKW